ncbi:MAG: lipid biosynthesis acyltransferase [Caulobacter sp.]|jgi:predicted LPLAT superfamily acyltransferase|nr:lipid biosynthesis acyltransferase [Caulobacter sp.]
MAATWANTAERGAFAGLWFVATVYRLLGRRVTVVLMAPLVLYFYLTGRRQREASLDWLRRAKAHGAAVGEVNFWTGLKHQMTFAGGALDRFSAWLGDIPPEKTDGLDDPEFEAVRADPRGAVVLSAHLGVPEVMRAIATIGERRGVNILAHSANAAKFAELMARMAPMSSVRIIEVTDLGLGAAMTLAASMEKGDWAVILADRIAPGGKSPSIWVPFLGQDAPFPAGPFILASALKCPVYTLFSVRQKGRYRVTLRKFSERLDFPRKDREAALKGSVTRFAGVLQEQALANPFQWFNFYDFWRL